MTVEIVRLGNKYTDSITGFSGVATARHEYLHGCIRYTLENKKGEDRTFDEQRLVGRKSRAFSGGPMPTPQRQRVPAR